jgi:hypothetical protein
MFFGTDFDRVLLLIVCDACIFLHPTSNWLSCRRMRGIKGGVSAIILQFWVGWAEAL